jgi:glycine betaine/proline transport system ATP-binding protein
LVSAACGKLGEEKELHVPSGPTNIAQEKVSSPAAPYQIECENVWKVFGKAPREALKAIESEGLDKDEAQIRFNCVIGVADVSLQIRKGEIFCIMGLSGSGKSTLLRHVNRLIEPTAGVIKIDGRDISQLDAKGLRRLRSETIGMVFQHMALWPHKTVQDNVAYGLEVRGVGKKRRREAAAKVLEQVKLAGWQTHYPDELSGGMQQRVGLARALAADPDILLMDEPFSALDPLIRSELQGQFLELSAELNKTTIFITHDLEEAIRMGHRVAIMKDGLVVQVGTPEQIVSNPQGDYVEKFVKGISRLRYLTADRVMTPLCQLAADEEMAASQDSARVRPDDGLHSIIDALQRSQGPVWVDDGTGRVGAITSSRLLEAIKLYTPG